MNFIDKTGREYPIDIENPNPNKIYKVVAAKFMTTGGDGITMFNKYDQAYEVYPYDKDKFVCDYLKKQTEPIVINHVGRIRFED